MNDNAIDTALHAGLNACLRSLQKTNPSLLLTCAQLKNTERDVLYIPKIASALSSMLLNSKLTDLKEQLLSKASNGVPSIVQVPSREQDKRSGDSCSDQSSALSSTLTFKNPSHDAQAELARCIEARIRQGLLSHEEERKMETTEKNNSRRKTKAIKESQDGESVSVSSSQYDLDKFIQQEETNNNMDSSHNGTEAPHSSDEDDMKSIFSHQSPASQSAENNAHEKNAQIDEDFDDDDEWW